ncbi:MAG TPA: GTPase Era [Salinivirgaceae bacterium]|nr:GTPase Era [Salinivirgaceae bacterium]
MENHKSGFINIIGNPNVGKSTLMNRLVGEKLSIISPKAQTTRHRIIGIVNGDNFQMVFSDTPGIINPNYILHKYMMKYVETALTDADIILFMTDTETDTTKDPIFLYRLTKTEIPLLLLINKIDLSNQPNIEKLVEYWHAKLPKASILPISAQFNINIDLVMKFILNHLPEGAPYFPKDQLSDKTMRFFVSEIIREKIFLNYQKEIPYCTEVVIEVYKELEDKIHIEATIYCERDSQKKILIGHKGEAIKKVGIESRKDIEDFVEQHVYLGLQVKVDPDWRNNENRLQRYGYTQ